MGTVVVIDLYASGNVDFDEVNLHVNHARKILQDADVTFSTWKDDSPITRLRRGQTTLDQEPTEVGEVLRQCEIARSISGGWFDPWAMPGGVDPTGYVKGWAAQRALRALDIPGVDGAIVNAAGDIAAFGGPGADAKFRIGITNPFSTHELACVIELESSVATSGTYERGEHLVDPRTGRPCSRVASASVTGPDLGLADALATALAVAGRAALDHVEALESYDGFIIEKDGSWSCTAGFPFALDAAPPNPLS